jgi:serine/threonine-protein kinase haspin
LQFYPSPSRYLDDTKFLIVELGDAGTALEDFELATADQLWDIFFHVAIAMARAEARIGFEACSAKHLIYRSTFR